MSNLGKEIRGRISNLDAVHHVVVLDKRGDKHCVDIESFITYADRVDYNSGYGTQNIDQSLKIIMRDGGWFERCEYDGSEWFTYHCPPSLDVIVEPFDPQSMTVASEYGGTITVDGVEMEPYYPEEEDDEQCDVERL